MFARNAKQKNDTKRQCGTKLMLFSEKLPKQSLNFQYGAGCPQSKK
jgi:hypothetical protein